ncbi:MAG: hypothetical protein A3D87_07410 [Omnitrophica WOR_2 bacterium RIFCSPHIGHO2_02_FULL_50_17]|nr:MAG: hypothetical protein A3D87_07410 [Omnitrophica WOR_2 bacterium RIFCSPHIGHO2_02_FULL_50_17]
MKIRIKDIRHEGLDVHGQIPAQTVGFTPEDSVYFIRPLDVQAQVQRAENTVLVKTHATGILASSCGRCLERVEQVWSQDFLLAFPIDRQTESIELDENIRQEAILHLPQRVLCKMDCKGICLGCGAGLNHEPCRCKSA